MPANFQQQTVITGVIQVVLGSLCLVLGTIELVFGYFMFSTIFGIATCGGFWILATGIIGVLAVRDQNCGGSFRCKAAVYMGFCITSILFACLIIITCSIVVPWYGVVNMSMPLLISIFEVGAAIWGVICSCATVRCCADPQTQAGQGMYMQTQAGGASVPYVIIEGSDGTPVAVPAQPSGAMVASGGTPVINQGGVVTTTVPPYYQTPMQQQQQQQQQQPQNDPAKVAL